MSGEAIDWTWCRFSSPPCDHAGRRGEKGAAPYSIASALLACMAFIGFTLASPALAEKGKLRCPRGHEFVVMGMLGSFDAARNDSGGTKS